MRHCAVVSAALRSSLPVALIVAIGSLVAACSADNGEEVESVPPRVDNVEAGPPDAHATPAPSTDAAPSDATTPDAAAIPADATSDASSTTDAGPIGTSDASSTTDAGPIGTSDASSTTDAGPIGTSDASSTTDAGPIGTPDASPPLDGGACNALEFGAATAPFALVPSLPPYTGGIIPAGTYDAVAAETTNTSLVGPNFNYRATWVFGAAGELHTLTQLQSGGALSAPNRLSGAWSTAGDALTRTFRCGSSNAQTNTYTVESAGGVTRLLYGTGVLRFALLKRP